MLPPSILKWQKQGIRMEIKNKKAYFDYEILNEQTYEFKVKEVGKPERTETIKKETEYKRVNGVYSNEPNLVGYKTKYTKS